MNLDLKINELPLELGQRLPLERLDEARFRRVGLLRRLLSARVAGHDIYDGEDCELVALGDELHIYPCTDSYLNRDRQWRTRVKLFVKQDRLQRELFQVVEGQTAAVNFLERFQEAASRALGEPAHVDRRSAVWESGQARVQTYLHPDRLNADFDISLVDDAS